MFTMFDVYWNFWIKYVYTKIAQYYFFSDAVYMLEIFSGYIVNNYRQEEDICVTNCWKLHPLEMFFVSSNVCALSFTLRANSVDDKLVIVFLFFPENRIWRFMQIVSTEDNLHEIQSPVLGEK